MTSAVAASALATRPTHVPAERVFDIDVYNIPIVGSDYQRTVKQLMNDPAVPEVFWSPHNGGHWVVTRAHLIQQILNDTGHFSSRNVVVPKDAYDSPPLMPLQVDPPDHSKYRDLLAGALSPKAVTMLGEAARELTIELIEGFHARGECEFMTEFAHHLPIAIFMRIVDLPPEDRPRLTKMAERCMRGETREIRNEARLAVAAYGVEKAGVRRLNPGTDLISTIATARIDGELLDDRTLAGIMLLVLEAGLDTVASMLGFFANYLAGHAEHRRRLVDNPLLIPRAVEELLRRHPMVVLAREVKEDIILDDVALKAGDMVTMPTQLDGLDERKFDAPFEVDFDRKGAAMHATFGGGAHRCMGSMLARTELRIFLDEWLKRIPDFSIKPGEQIRLSARANATISYLPLVWDPA
jgi:cytochrome P450